MKRLMIVVLTVVMAVILGGCHSDSPNTTKAKYIFLMIGDGMGHSHIDITESYISSKAGKLGGEQLTMTKFPFYGTCSTYCEDQTITCSAAAGTAIACGQKTCYSRIGCDKNYNRLESMAYKLKEDGYKIGLLSSVPINQATPAAFYASAKSRYDGYEIIKQIPQSGFEFIGGSGIEEMYGKDGNQLKADKYLEQMGYEVCFGEDEFREVADTCERIILCQSKSRDREPSSYTLEDAEEATDMSLATMLKMAIGHLGEDSPFFIMCEGGEIDWVAHANLTMPTIESIIRFDEAIAVAYEFYKKHPEETIIVVTADHETGGIALGQGESWSNTYIDWAKVEDEWEKQKSDCYKDANANREFNKAAHIGWTTSYHTGGTVPVYSIGKGAEKFSGRIDNTEIRGKLLGE